MIKSSFSRSLSHQLKYIIYTLSFIGRFSESAPAVNGAYSKVLDPKISKCDVTYWLNKITSDEDNGYDEINRKWKWGAMNTASKLMIYISF